MPREQPAALSAWLSGAIVEERVVDLAIADAAIAKRLVRAAVASLRRHAVAA